jgi:hypothetical protein
VDVDCWGRGVSLDGERGERGCRRGMRGCTGVLDGVVEFLEEGTGGIASLGPGVTASPGVTWCENPSRVSAMSADMHLISFTYRFFAPVFRIAVIAAWLLASTRLVGISCGYNPVVSLAPFF